MRDALLAEGIGHSGDLHATHHAAEVEHIRLDDGESAVGDEPAEVVGAGLLLPAGDGYFEGVGNLFGFFVPVERDGLFVEGVLVLLHELADGDGLGGGVGTVGVGGDDHLIAKGFADKWNELLASAGRGFNVAHAAAYFELDGFGVGDGYVALEVFDCFFGGNVALAVGLVDGDAGIMDFIADEQANGTIGHFAEHIEDGKLNGGNGDPDGEALRFVVALVDGSGGNQLLDVARILADKVGSDALYEHGVKGRHLLRIRDGDAFVSVGGANAAEVFLFVAKQFNALNDDGIGEEFALENGFFENGIELGEALLERTGESVPGGVEKLCTRLEGKSGCCCGAAGKSGGDEIAAVRLHYVIS